MNWENVLFECITDEILHLACILLNQAWPEGFIFCPQAFESWLTDFLRVLEAPTDARELSKLQRHRLSAALLDNKDVVVALWHCKWTRKQLEDNMDNTTGAERVRGFADHYSALKICPQSRTVYHYNSITGYVDKRFGSFSETVVAALEAAVPGDSRWTFEEVRCAQQGQTNHCAAFTLPAAHAHLPAARHGCRKGGT